MPGYKTHLTVGLLSFAAISYSLINVFAQSFDSSKFFIGLCACLIGSIFPDIDTASKMQRLFFILAAIFISISFLLNNFVIFSIFAALSLIIVLLKHRTITHNIMFVLILTALLPTYTYFYYKCYFNESLIFSIFFIVGSFSHILLDFFVSKILKK